MSVQSINEFNDITNLSFYQSELVKKDKQILKLQNKINSLLFNKNSLVSPIDRSFKKNIPSLKSISPKNNYSKNSLYSSFQTLQYDNSLLNNKITINDQIGEKYNNTLHYKLLSAQREIENLTTMNTIKDKIIMNVQNFINNINNVVCNGKLNLNINQLDIKTFIKNLQLLEQKIIKRLLIMPNPYKIPDSIIKTFKENSIRKQKTEVALIKKKKHLYIYPLDQRTYKINNNTNINNESKYSNHSYLKQNITNQNYIKKPNKELKLLRSSTNRNNSKIKENKIQLKRYLLNKRQELYSKTPIKKNIKSLENKRKFDDFKSINIKKEVIFSRILNNYGNGIFNKKSSIQ